MLSFFCQILWHTTEVGCYTGTALSAVLAWRLFRHIWKRWLMIIDEEEAFIDFSFSIVKQCKTSTNIACMSVQDGNLDLDQQNVPLLLLHGLCVWHHRHLLPLQAVQGKVTC